MKALHASENIVILRQLLQEPAFLSLDYASFLALSWFVILAHDSVVNACYPQVSGVQGPSFLQNDLFCARGSPILKRDMSFFFGLAV